MLSEPKKTSLTNAYKAGREAEREYLVSLVEKLAFTWMGDKKLLTIGKDELLDLLQAECSCDPCGSPECDCYGKRCDYCLSWNE